MMKKVAEVCIAKLEDRRTLAGILLENGYTVSPYRRKKKPNSKTIEYCIRVYEEDMDAEQD